MRTFSIAIFFTLYSFLSFAQVSEYTFMGALIIKGSKPYSFQLEFKDSAGIISGFSITDIQGPDQTRTAVTGRVDRSRKEFSFQETRLISTRSKVNRDSFCYIRAKLKLKERKGSKLLSGNFTGYMKDGISVCGKGEVTLMSKSDILNKLMKLGPGTDTLVKLLNKKDTLTLSSEAVNAVPQQTQLSVSAGSITPLNCEGNKIVLELWDNSKIDGDIISLLHGDKALLNRYTLSNKKEQFTIELTGNSTERIRLIAEAEGSEPPTTVRLSCTCGNRSYLIDASSSIGKPVELIIQ